MTHPIAALFGSIVSGHEDVRWSEKRPLNDAAKAIVRAAMADSEPLRKRREALNVVAKALVAAIYEADEALAADKSKFFDAIAAAQPELAGECLRIDDKDMTYQIHVHKPKPEGPKPPEWVDEILNDEGKANG
jgi:hypothetical protein